jgi:steroid 5-alpha reductase family enzyme
MWAWVSPAFTAFLLLKVSGVPMVEAAGKKKWGDNPEYQNYMKHTNMLIPGSPAPPMKKD